MLNNNERRNFPRMSAKCDITYKKNNESETLKGDVIELSASGLSFQAKQPLSIGTTLDISVIPETKITPALNAIIEVKRVTPESNQYKIAAEIKKIKNNST